MEDHGNTSDNMIDKIYLLEYNKIRREQIFLQSRNLFRPTKTRLYAEIRSTDGCFFFYLWGKIWHSGWY